MLIQKCNQWQRKNQHQIADWKPSLDGFQEDDED